jgi:hypothetical protein
LVVGLLTLNIRNGKITDMERYTINISFKTEMFETVSNIVEKVKTLKEAMSYKDLIDETVNKALIKDNVTGRVTWLKE